MALAIDSSSPAIAASGYLGSSPESYASNPFSPPAGSVIQVVATAYISYQGTATSAPTITDSLGSHLTWTLQKDVVTSSGVEPFVAVWTAPCPSAQTSMTVTPTFYAPSGQYISSVAVAVQVLTGANSTGPVGTKASGTSSAATLSEAITPSASGSILFMAATLLNSVSTTCTAGGSDYIKAGNSSYNSAFALEYVGTSGGPVLTPNTSAQTLTMTATTGTPTGWNYIIWELLASAGYTVTFNANGGTGSLTAEGPYSVATALSLFSTGSMAYTGYAFTGWNTAADGTGTAYADGASYPFSANATLYAQWALVHTATIINEATPGFG